MARLQTGRKIITSFCKQLQMIPSPCPPNDESKLKYLLKKLRQNLEVRRTDQMRLARASIERLARTIFKTYSFRLPVWPSQAFAFIRYQLFNCKDPMNEAEFLEFIEDATDDFSTDGERWNLCEILGYKNCACGCGGYLVYESRRLHLLYQQGLVRANNPFELIAEMHGHLGITDDGQSVWSDFDQPRYFHCLDSLH